jgi:hypothetical protein
MKPLSSEEIRAIMAKSKQIPTRGEIVRDLLRSPTPAPQPSQVRSGNGK